MGNTGYTMTDIAKETGLSKRNVWRYAVILGLNKEDNYDHGVLKLTKKEADILRARIDSVSPRSKQRRGPRGEK